MLEVWKRFSSNIWVSNFGGFKKDGVLGKGLSKTTEKRGKQYYKFKHKKDYRLNREVARLFIGDVTGKDVHHRKEFETLNNHIDNLQILTRAEHNRLHHIGLKHSEETKLKMNKSLKGKIPWNKGKHHTEEHKRKTSESNTKHLFCTIANCNNKHRVLGLCNMHYTRFRRRKLKEIHGG